MARMDFDLPEGHVPDWADVAPCDCPDGPCGWRHHTWATP